MGYGETLEKEYNSILMQVPDITASVLLCIPSFISAVTFLCFQGKLLNLDDTGIFGLGFTTPLEFGMNFVYIVFLMTESYFGYKVKVITLT